MEVIMKKYPIKYKKERVVLSDVLPYEIPVIYSNRYFYKFLTEYKVKIDSKKLTVSWENKKNDEVPDEVIKLFFGIKDISNQVGTFYENEKSYALKTIPFIFKIAHKENDYRELSIIHPLNQLHLVEFYDEFKETIKYYSSISEYSIRRPHKTAKYKFKNDYIYKMLKAENVEHDKIEIASLEYENLKTFFTYKQYSNINKFFESYQYQRSEKKYNKMYKLDVSKCFDSIYTHSIVWALHNKEIVKDNIRTSNGTFAGLFDKFMQNINYGVTNGILIGSEFARIFAELLLQQIDKLVLDELLHKNCFHKKNYEIYRYVDDYFIFYDEETIKDTIVDLYKHNLKKYNLHISKTKSMGYIKPIITELTIAKTKITDLINEQLTIKKHDSDDEDNINWSLYINSKKIITRLKIIIKETGIEYKDIINYTLTMVERKNNLLINVFQDTDEFESHKKNFIKASLEILDIAFFIYAVSPRVSSTIKISSLLSKLLLFIKNTTNIAPDEKEIIYKKIFDEILFILNKNRLKHYTQIETLYLLIVLNELGKEYRLEETLLLEYFFQSTNDKTLNYFSITTLLFYIKNIVRYSNVKIKIKEEIKKKLESSNKDNLYKNTELLMLLMDSLTCPYLEESFKYELLCLFNMNDVAVQTKIIYFKKYWFIKWNNFNFVNEIESKKSQEVYS